MVLLSLAATVMVQAAIASPRAAAPRVDPNARICQDVIPTGTILRRQRICLTASEWRDFDGEIAKRERPMKDALRNNAPNPVPLDQ